MKVCIKKDPQGNSKLREAFVDRIELFTAMALAATALLSRSMHLNHPRDAVINVRRLMEAAKSWGAHPAACIIPDYLHFASAAASLMAAFLPYPNIPWGVDEGTGPTAAILLWACYSWQLLPSAAPRG
eukprot:jgi/Tetstr1/458099/TSEL_044606.t1